MLWTDERIQDEVTKLSTMQYIDYVSRANIQASLMKMREEYHAKLLLLEREIVAKDGYVDDLEAKIAELEAENVKLRTTGRDLIIQRDKSDARIAKLEAALSPEQKFDDAYGMLSR